MLAPGDPLPGFRGRTAHGEAVEAGGLRGRPALIMFYPHAFSPVCGSELLELANRWPEAAGIDASVLTISCDSVHVLRAYATVLGESSGRGEPEWTQVSDFWPHGQIARAFGVFDPATGSPRRISFFADSSGIVRSVQEAGLTEPRSIEHALRMLASLD